VLLGSDLEALVRERPAPLVRCEPISRHGSTRETRETFRLDFADGSTLKGRRLPSPAAARRVETAVLRLDPHRFPGIVARRGSALLETWVRGQSLDRVPPEPRHLRWAAETLARVHRLPPLLPHSPHWVRARRALLSLHLRRLVEKGVLPEPAALRLKDLALANAPEEVDLALVHRDVCPENIVVDPQGRLFCVDNATVRGGAPDEDLARTCYRWPLDGAALGEFLDAYRAHRDPATFVAHRRFWMISALVHATWIRHSRGYARADVPRRRLLEQLADSAEKAQDPCCASPTDRS